MPDFVRALKAKKPIFLRRPDSVRPWQHVLEPLSGYINLLERILTGDYSINGAWNFGPSSESSITVEALTQRIINAWGEGSYQISKDSHLPESELLYLDSSKARHYLNWSPVWDIDTTIIKTAEWYKTCFDTDAFALCARQIEDYRSKMTKRTVSRGDG